ncbi:MAG: chitobiase/beta-hexosaminidase C-terminal domain-containing protein, partial [Oscillospiraceae bacterium]
GAMEMLGRQVKERAIPAQDKHTLEVLSKRAGNIVANASALTKANVCERISTGTQTLDDAEIPDTDRWLFVSSLTYKYLRLSDEFMKVDSMAKESLEKGVVGMYDNMSVVKIPAARWPSNVNFIICHKSSATSPSKISETKCHKDPPGISGNLLEGRFYYDCFVLAARCNGVYAEIDASQGKGVVCAAPTQTNGTFASTTAGASFKYTDDGSDPRYSLTAKAEATESAAAGTVIRVYAYKTGNFDSAVFTYTAQ